MHVPDHFPSPCEHGLGTFNSLVGSHEVLDLTIHPDVDNLLGSRH
jgi:hypothetical protein